MRRDDAEQLDAALSEIDWAELPDCATRARFLAPSGSLAAVSLGDPSGQRVLLVPGVTGSKEDFALMLPGLAAAGYYVQSFDLAGQYESADAGPPTSSSSGSHYDHELFVADLIAVLEAGSTPVHVLGYSFAGTIAQIALSRRPELFASITLLSCPPQPGQGFRGVKRIGPLSWLATGRIGAALMIWGIRRNFIRVSAARLRFVNHRFRYTRRRSVSDVVGLMKHGPDLRTTLAASAIPKLVAVGEHDLWPLTLHASFAAEIGATLAVYPAGHSPCETSPHQLTRDLLNLFESAGR